MCVRAYFFSLPSWLSVLPQMFWLNVKGRFLVGLSEFWELGLDGHLNHWLEITCERLILWISLYVFLEVIIYPFGQRTFISLLPHFANYHYYKLAAYSSSLCCIIIFLFLEGLMKRPFYDYYCFSIIKIEIFFFLMLSFFILILLLPILISFLPIFSAETKYQIKHPTHLIPCFALCITCSDTNNSKQRIR